MFAVERNRQGMGIGRDQGAVTHREAGSPELKCGRPCALECSNGNDRALDALDRAYAVVGSVPDSRPAAQIAASISDAVAPWSALCRRTTGATERAHRLRLPRCDECGRRGECRIVRVALAAEQGKNPLHIIARFRIRRDAAVAVDDAPRRRCTRRRQARPRPGSTTATNADRPSPRAGCRGYRRRS